MLEGFLFCIQ